MDKETEVWFAMRATYRRELEAMHLLEKANLGCFIPMQYKISIRRGRKVRALVPVIRNLVFVHARPSEVQRFKSQITYLQYITDTRSGQKIVIPDHDMQRFIAVAGTYNDHLLYFQRPMLEKIQIRLNILLSQNKFLYYTFLLHLLP